MNLHPDTPSISLELLQKRVVELEEEVGKRQTALDNVLGALVEVNSMVRFLTAYRESLKVQEKAKMGEFSKAVEESLRLVDAAIAPKSTVAAS